MDILKLGFLFCIYWCQIGAENVCSNNFSYVFKDKCYSLHADLAYNYTDAVSFCQKYGGILWSMSRKEETDFLRKILAKTFRPYWVGIRQDLNNWIYLSDNSHVPETLIGKPQNTGNQCIVIQQPEGKIRLLRCDKKVYAVCEYTGDICEAREDEGKGCYEITTGHHKTFTNAAKTCKLFGGRLAEFHNEDQLSKLRTQISKQEASIENIPVQNIPVFTGTWFPPIWSYKYYQLQDDKMCEYYTERMIIPYKCSHRFSFACKFDAISSTAAVTAAKAQPNLNKLHTLEGVTSSDRNIIQEIENVQSEVTTTQPFSGIRSRLDHNTSLNAMQITILIIGTIIMIGIIVIMTILVNIMRKRDMVKNCRCNSEFMHALQNFETQRTPLNNPTRNLLYEDTDINQRMQTVAPSAIPTGHQERSLQPQYFEII